MTEHRRPSSPPERRLPDYRPVEPPGGGGQYRAQSGLAEAEKGGGGEARDKVGARAGVPMARHSRDDGGHTKLEVAARPSAKDTYGPATTYGPGAAPAPLPEPPKRPNRTPVASAGPVGVLPPGAPAGPGGPGGPGRGGPGGGGGSGGFGRSGGRGPGGRPPQGGRTAAQPPRRRLIDYPRAGKSGLMRLVPSWKLVTAVATAFVMSLMLAFVVMYQRTTLPDVNSVLDRQATIVYMATGRELARLGPTNRVEISIAKMPTHLQNAVLAAENRTFYTDKGFSPRGITRAFINNLTGGNTQGGSTITQQYAKMAFTDSDRTFSRKINELFMSMKLEQRYTKQQILEDYLNAVYLGRGAYGVEAAANVYFHKSAEKLTVAQSAVIAALLRSPEGLYSPDKSKESLARLQARWRYVLDGMVDMGALSKSAAAKAKFPKILEYESRNRYAGTKGYLLSAAEAEVRAALEKSGDPDPDQTIKTGGLRIHLTINPTLQKDAEEAVAEEWPKEGTTSKDHLGLVAVEPGTGRILAMYGGKDYIKKPFNDATQARVAPGSTFKIFALAAAMRAGWSLERNYFYGNSPLEIKNEKPVSNQGNEDWGAHISLLRGAENSINTVFVDMMYRKDKEDGIKPSKVIEAAIDAGIPKDTPDLLPNVRVPLGIAVPTVKDMAGAYATFAAGGIRATPHIVEKAFYGNGAPIDMHRPEPKQGVFTDQEVANLDYALTQVVQNGTGHRAQALGRPAAGKTGNNQSKSVWFAGYTPNQLAAAVGIWRGNGKVDLNGFGGYDTPEGGRFPTLIWTAFMKKALEGKEVTQFPPYQDFDQVPYPWGFNQPQWPPATPPSSTEPPGGGGGGGGGGGHNCPPNCGQTTPPPTLNEGVAQPSTTP